MKLQITLVLSIYFIISCQNTETATQQISTTQEEITQTTDNQSMDYLNDTLAKYNITGNTKKAVLTIFTDSLETRQNNEHWYQMNIEEISLSLNRNFLLDSFKFNDYQIIQIGHTTNAHHGYAKDLLLFKNDTLICSYYLHNTHYYPFEVEIKDWNKDGQDEIIATLVAPTQSVPAISYWTSVISYDEKSKSLKEVFSIETDDRSCGSSTGDHKGTQVKNNIQIKNPKNIQVKTNYYSFNCLNYEKYEPIKNRALDSTKVNNFIWNEVNFKYE